MTSRVSVLPLGFPGVEPWSVPSPGSVHVLPRLHVGQLAACHRDHGRFPGPRLRLSDAISTFEDGREGTLLDGGWFFEAVGVESSQHVVFQLHGFEGRHRTHVAAGLELGPLGISPPTSPFHRAKFFASSSPHPTAFLPPTPDQTVVAHNRKRSRVWRSGRPTWLDRTHPRPSRWRCAHLHLAYVPMDGVRGACRRWTR